MFIELINQTELVPDNYQRPYPHFSTFLFECSKCPEWSTVFYDANSEMPTVITCPACHEDTSLFVCMNEECTNLQPAHNALIVRFGDIVDGKGIRDTDFSNFDGPQYACSTKCLVAAMTAPDAYEFVPEKDYHGPFDDLD